MFYHTCIRLTSLSSTLSSDKSARPGAILLLDEEAAPDLPAAPPLVPAPDALPPPEVPAIGTGFVLASFASLSYKSKKMT